jgi:hypothetical protein
VTARLLVHLTSVLDTHPCHKNGRFVTGIISIIHLHIKNESNKYFIRYKIGVFPIAFLGMGKNTQKGKNI